MPTAEKAGVKGRTIWQVYEAKAEFLTSAEKKKARKKPSRFEERLCLRGKVERDQEEGPSATPSP